MLDRAAFVREMTLLHDRFGRTPNEHVISRYYDTLSRDLTTADFERAARIIFDEDQFWPAPARFREAAQGGNPKELAGAEWERLVAAAAAGQTDVGFLSPAGVAAMRAAGGWMSIAFCEGESKLNALRRAFTAAWLDATGVTPDGRALPAPAVELVLS
jgi:hypothetical protein